MRGKKLEKSKARSSVTRNYEASRADTLLEVLKSEIKPLKLEAKSLHTEIKEEEKSLEKELDTSQTGHSASKVEKLKGNELLKLSHLVHMGFAEETIKRHLEQENRRLEELSKNKQQDRRNLESNISKMIAMNEQSEKAVGAAQEQYNRIRDDNSKLKAQLEDAELKLYSIESKVKHSRNIKTVDITNKQSLRNEIKEIANEIKTRCEDKAVVQKVLRVAGKCLAADMELSLRSFKEEAESDSDSSSSVDISSASSEEGA